MTRSPMQRVMALIEFDDDSGCWPWIGSTQDGSAKIHLTRGNAVGVRRWLFEEFGGAKLPANKVATCGCSDETCVRPTCTKIVTRGAMVRKARKDCGNARWTARIIAAKRANSSLTIDTVRELRARYAKGEYQCDLAREHGLTKHNVYRIVRNLSWRESAGPLAMLAQQAGMLP